MMNEKIIELKTSITEFGDAARNGALNESNSDGYIYRIIEAGAWIYRDEDIKMLIPLINGSKTVCEEEGRYYVPLYTDTDELNKTGITEYRETTFKEAAGYVYENINNYQLLDNIEYAMSQGYNMSDLIEYAQNNPRYEGIMINSLTGNPFCFEGWMFQAMMFKGMGVTSFQVIDSETGKVEQEL